MNASIRRIDLTVNILAPIVVGQIMTFVSMIAAGIFIASRNLISMFVEYSLLLCTIYNKIPALSEKTKKPTAPKQDSGSTFPHYGAPMEDGGVPRPYSASQPRRAIMSPNRSTCVRPMIHVVESLLKKEANSTSTTVKPFLIYTYICIWMIAFTAAPPVVSAMPTSNGLLTEVPDTHQDCAPDDWPSDHLGKPLGMFCPRGTRRETEENPCSPGQKEGDHCCICDVGTEMTRINMCDSCYNKATTPSPKWTTEKPPDPTTADYLTTNNARYQTCPDILCANSGSCIIAGNRVTHCACVTGWMGPFCEEDIDECLTQNTCGNGGTCRNLNGGFQCTCPGGWQGSNCQIKASRSEWWIYLIICVLTGLILKFIPPAYRFCRQRLPCVRQSVEKGRAATDPVTTDPAALPLYPVISSSEADPEMPNEAT